MSHARELAGQPDLPAIHQQDPDTWPYLLDSTSRGGALGRWSMLMHADPESPAIRLDSSSDEPFLARLEREWRRERRVQPGRLPFEGGWFLYLGYELVGEIEPKLRLPESPPDLPTALARRCTGALLVNHGSGRAFAVAESVALVDRIAQSAGGARPGSPDGKGSGQCQRGRPVGRGVGPGRFPRMVADDGERFMQGVRRIREYILAGDVFQVNLSRAWQGLGRDLPEPAAIYRNLALRNPAPFAGLARFPRGTLLSSSPERLVAVRGDTIEARPIAGTRPRGASPEQDRALSTELLAHPKERAEHIMLIDLERNDLGRICSAGTVEVDELMVVESYAHVHHIVSNVRGRMVPGTSPAEVIRAVFPGGTITGCPKVRCMEIIAELESSGRGFYTGSMGYLGLDGRMDLNILIRSMLVTADGIRFRTGAGIVADSLPEAELVETEAKARGLMRALEDA